MIDEKGTGKREKERKERNEENLRAFVSSILLSCDIFYNENPHLRVSHTRTTDVIALKVSCSYIYGFSGCIAHIHI